MVMKFNIPGELPIQLIEIERIEENASGTLSSITVFLDKIASPIYQIFGKVGALYEIKVMK